MTQSVRKRLAALAEQLGILPSYYDIRGRLHETSDATLEDLAAAMGFDASTEDAAAESLARLVRDASAGLVDPVYVAFRSWFLARSAARVVAEADKPSFGPIG